MAESTFVLFQPFTGAGRKNGAKTNLINLSKRKKDLKRHLAGVK